MATSKPLITEVNMSKTTVSTKETFTVKVVVVDAAWKTTDVQYAKSTNYELISGQQIGVL